MRKRLLIFLLVLTSICSFAQPGTLDPSFNPTDKGFGIGDGITGTVRATVVQPDGKILVAGWFHAYDGTYRYRIARLNTDGTLDVSFDPGYGASGTITAMTLQSDGKILIGGVFQSYQSTLVPAIARLNPDGSLDGTFTSGLDGNSSVYSISVQSDGKIVIGGNFSSYNGTSRNRIARLNPDGSLDASFNVGTGTNMFVHATAVQADGKILVGGEFTTYNGIPSSKLVRLNTDGSVDATFNAGRSGVYGTAVYALQVLNDGKIMIGGDFSGYNNTVRYNINRLNADGTTDATFDAGSGTVGIVRTIVAQGEGKILIAGEFTRYSTTDRNRIARINADGTIDTAFDPGTGADNTVHSIAIQPDGKILVGGDLLSYNGISRHHILRVNSNGALDLGFYNVKNTGAQGPIHAMAVQADGKILIGGEFFLYNDKAKAHLARLHPDGSLDETFNAGGLGPNENINTIVIQPDGKILIGGSFYKYNGIYRNGIVRLNPDGSLDPTFNPGNGPAGGLMAIALQPDGKILIGGIFFEYNGNTRGNLARLNANGTLDATFNTTIGTNSYITTIAVQSDGKILIGGNFTTYKSIARNHIARLNADGSLDISFDPGSGADRIVETITPLNDGKILVGGGFAQFNGVIRSGIARIDSTGLVDPTFNANSIGVGGTVHSTIVQPDGKILVGGLFSSYNGFIRKSIVRIDTSGMIDRSFNSGKSDMRTIEAMALMPNNDIMIAGDFTWYNDIGRNRIARLYGGTLSTDTLSSTSYCQGSTISIPYTVTGGYNAGNIFTAQLSDANGSFASPITIGTLNSTTSDTIRGIIPVGTPAGTGYKIRILVEDAGIVSTNDASPITIKALPVTPVVTANAATTFCQGRRVTLTSSAATGNQWYKAGIAIDTAIAKSFTVSESGSYAVITTVNGCSSVSSPISITVTPAPAKPTITQVGNTLTASAANSYQWYLNGEQLPGATSQSYNVQAAGLYTVQITQTGCTADATSDPLNFVATAIVSPDTWNGEVSIYPNPVATTLYLKNNNNRKLHVQLVDAFGKVVYKQNVTSTTQTIDVQTLASGIYRLLVTDTTRQQTISFNIFKP